MLAGMFAVLLMAQGATVHPPVPIPEQPNIQGSGDAVVLGYTGAMDANTIEAAKLASTKGSGDVKTFATLLLHDHQVSLANNDTLANRFQIKRLLPDDSMMARAHREGMTKLNVLSGAAFDKAFMQMVVADHKAAVAKINGSLLGQATRPEVKTYLQKEVPGILAHQHTAEAWLAAHR